MKRLRPLPSTDSRVKDPMFTFRDAALYLDVKVATLHHWAHPNRGEPLITTLRDQSPSLPFIGFAEAFVIKAAKNAGVPDHRIRPGVEAIRERAGDINHALASELVWVDGAEILWGVAGDDPEVARSGQRAFREAIKGNLRLVKYGDDGFAKNLVLPKYEDRGVRVTVNPYVAGGMPIIRSGIGVRVKDVLDLVRAGDSPEQVARSFRIPVKEVEEVIGNA